jgi:hypothetical protein
MFYGSLISFRLRFAKGAPHNGELRSHPLELQENALIHGLEPGFDRVRWLRERASHLRNETFLRKEI